MQYNLELTVHVFVFKLKDLQSSLGFVLFLASLDAVASEFSMQWDRKGMNTDVFRLLRRIVKIDH